MALVQKVIAEQNLQGELEYGAMTVHGFPVLKLLIWSESSQMIFAGKLTLDLPEITFVTTKNEYVASFRHCAITC
jgi:hypothetical protein